MFFKPNYCCNCGEKIQRAEWKVLTSRRFCDVCSVENQGHEWLPRIAVAAALLVGLFGFGSYLRSYEQQPFAPPGAMRASDPRRMPPAGTKPEAAEQVSERPATVASEPTADPARPGSTNVQPRLQSFASDDPVYYCGAMTKKGKPCSRRVKTNGRCWQHKGQPSALASQPGPDIY